MSIKQFIAAAGLVAATLGGIGAADAQHHGDRGDRHRGDRYGHYDRHHDRGRHRGYAYGHRCRVEYRHHHRVRICR